MGYYSNDSIHNEYCCNLASKYVSHCLNSNRLHENPQCFCLKKKVETLGYKRIAYVCDFLFANRGRFITLRWQYSEIYGFMGLEFYERENPILKMHVYV